jgi:hypothetical protein
MKLRILICVIASALLFSCSSDDGDSGSNSIVGTWDLVSLELDGDSPEEASVQLLIGLLAAQDCYLITLQFADNGTATFETSLAYFDSEDLITGSLDIDCPDQSDSESATYVYESGQLDITDSEGITTSVAVVLSGERLTFDLEGSEFADVGADGSMIFERR